MILKGLSKYVLAFHYDPCKLLLCRLIQGRQTQWSVPFGIRRYWLSYKCFCLLKKLSNWEYIIFSMTFEIAGSRDIGL